jgi:hypothetical protein
MLVAERDKNVAFKRIVAILNFITRDLQGQVRSTWPVLGLSYRPCHNKAVRLWVGSWYFSLDQAGQK